MADEVFPFLSKLEQKVYVWLIENKILFDTQERMFGTAGELGTATIDFMIPDRNLILRVMGSYWHSSFEAKARDQFAKERLIGQGYIVVDLWEENLEDDEIDRTMRLALDGREVPR